MSVIAVGAKAPRKQVGGSSSAASSFGSPTSSGSSRNKYAGGNPVKWWPSPKWQKGTKAKDTSGKGLQCAKKVVSDSPEIVDFAIGLGNFVLNLPDGQVKFFEEFELQKNCKINSAH